MSGPIVKPCGRLIVAGAVRARSRPRGAGTVAEEEGHLRIGRHVDADDIVLLDRELASLVEEGDDLLDIRARRRSLIVGEEERNGHREEHADQGDDYNQLGDAEAGLAEGAPAHPPRHTLPCSTHSTTSLCCQWSTVLAFTKSTIVANRVAKAEGYGSHKSQRFLYY